MSTNPLSKFFRQPAIYIRLPSQGQGWPAGALDLPVNGELPVLPMTAIDEITYRTPDALFNGESVVSVVASCVPNIRDPWAIPTTDLDALLIAIRIASSGHNIDIDTTCPSCETESSFEMDLRNIMDRLSITDYTKSFTQGDLTFYFRPLNYREITDNSLEQFEYQKTLQALNTDTTGLDEKDKVSKLNSMMRNLIAVTVKAMSQSIVEIRTQEAVVSNRAHIEEFLSQCDRIVFNRVRDHVISLRESSELKPLSVTCPNCSHQYQQTFTLDMANFFDSAS
jgi:hypothetical protein